VIKHKLEVMAKPKHDLETMSKGEVDALKKHIVSCIIKRDDSHAMKLKNPCAPFLYELIPTLFPIARSKIHYLLKLINAVARFYPDEIVMAGKDEQLYGLVAPKHNWLAIQIYIDAFVTECLQMPSHGTDLLQLIPDSDVDKYGMVTSEVIKMSKREIQQAARSAGLPFAMKNITPLLGSLVMLGFLEMDEENNKKIYFKSPLIKEPSTKINWDEVIESTKKFMKEYWPEIADEYIGRHCVNVEVTNPFTHEKTIIGPSEEKDSTSQDKEITKDTPDDYGAWYGEG